MNDDNEIRVLIVKPLRGDPPTCQAPSPGNQGWVFEINLVQRELRRLELSCSSFLSLQRPGSLCLPLPQTLPLFSLLPTTDPALPFFLSRLQTLPLKFPYTLVALPGGSCSPSFRQLSRAGPTFIEFFSFLKRSLLCLPSISPPFPQCATWGVWSTPSLSSWPLCCPYDPSQTACSAPLVAPISKR